MGAVSAARSIFSQHVESARALYAVITHYEVRKQLADQPDANQSIAGCHNMASSMLKVACQQPKHGGRILDNDNLQGVLHVGGMAQKTARDGSLQ